MATEIIFNQLLIFGVLVSVGVFFFWKKIITIDLKNNLARIVIDVTLPFLIFSTFAKMDSDSHHLRNGLIVFCLALLNLFVLNFIGRVSSKVLKLKSSQETVHTLHTMLGNTVFLGFPLLDALFPNGVGVFYGALYQLASNSVTFTFGVYKLSAGTQKSGWKSMLNFNTFAVGLGIIWLVLGLKLPSFVHIPFEALGKCTSPLSMVYIGAMLASMNIRSTIKQLSIYVLSFNKLLLVPSILAVSYLFLFHSFNLKIDKEAFYVLILQAAMPCQTIVVVLSHRYNSDYQLAGANLFISTLLSVISLPLMFFILDIVWKAF